MSITTHAPGSCQRMTRKFASQAYGHASCTNSRGLAQVLCESRGVSEIISLCGRKAQRIINNSPMFSAVINPASRPFLFTGSIAPGWPCNLPINSMYEMGLCIGFSD